MSDKRTVSTDALETLGMIHTREEKRDAIHLAVIPAEAGERLKPGSHVRIAAGGEATYAVEGEDGVGIVDPFLSAPVERGQRFWLVIYPRKITSLRHVWSHPAFPDEAAPEPTAVPTDAVAAAKAAVHELAVDLGLSDDALMEGAKFWAESNGGYDEYMCFEHDLSYGWDMPKFWAAYSLLTGENVPENMRKAFFTCAC